MKFKLYFFIILLMLNSCSKDEIQPIALEEPVYNIQEALDNGESIASILVNYPPESLYGKTYAGGLIFYIDTVNNYGIVAAPNDQSTASVWWNGSYQQGSSDVSAGSGANNTTYLVSVQGPGDYAAYLCDTLTMGGYSDWYLPSSDDLTNAYNNLHLKGLGGFSLTRYWSSSDILLQFPPSIIAGDFEFLLGFSTFTQQKDWALRVRAARTFNY